MHRSARRIAAVSLSSLRVEIARQIEPSLEGRPVAIVVAREGGAVRDETSLLGNTRIDEVSPEARALGVLPEMTIAAARARHADVSVRVVGERAAKDALALVAELALGFGATVAFDADTHVVWADVTGCAHLHDARDHHRGETLLARELARKIAALGHLASVAVADGPRVSAMLAKMLDGADEHVLVVPRERTREAILALPIAALPLSEAAKHWLARLGVVTAEGLATLPRASLASRLGEEARDLFLLLDGADTSPLDPYRPPETPVERVDLEYGIEGGEALLFVVRTLATRMAARLEGRALGTSEISLVFELDDAARSHEKQRRTRLERKIVLASPIRAEADLFAVARARIEAAERRRETFAAPILAVEIHATKLARGEVRNLDLIAPESRAARALPQLAAELAADLGEGAAGLLALESSHDPVERVRLVPWAGGSAPSSLSVSIDVPEPSRFLPNEGARELLSADGPLRLVSRSAWRAWWKRPVELESRRTTTRDWVTGWSSEAGALAWIEIDTSTGLRVVRGWE